MPSQTAAFVGLLISLLIGSVGTARAAPIQASSLIWALQYEGGNGAAAPITAITAASSWSGAYTSNLSNDIRSRGNLRTGDLGAQVQSTALGTSGQTLVSLYDTLSFSSPGGQAVEISYSAHLDGELIRANNLFSSPYAQYRVSVYDITGLDHWLETRDFFGLWETVDPTSEAVRVADSSIDASVQQGAGPLRHVLDETRSGSFLAEPGRVYGVRLTINSFADDGGQSNFLGTGSFRFIDLAGAQFQSASGFFLADITAHQVPLPGTLLLAATAALGLGLARRPPAGSAMCTASAAAGLRAARRPLPR